ncbi:polymeric immunoglobulin receptor-like [Sardina pilchardus]|uniref:polymeric immunoglobulin receptor-like n=1 Tax=Sardina pilchardus TaxID=27697 RepID=UPI002E1535D9
MGGIAILCKFNNMHTNKKRYFCKGNSTTCPHNRFTNGTDSRFFQYENEFNKAHLLVLLTNLTTQDTGMYHCAVEDEEMQAAFNLNIKEVDCCDSPNTTTGHVGGHKRIQCKYPEEAKTNVKHFFKQHDTFVDLDFITSNSLPKNTKYSQSDNKSANVFTVTIHELERKDAGIYWCGLRTAGNNVALTGQVNLQITGVTGIASPIASREVVGFSEVDGTNYEDVPQELSASNIQMSSVYQNLNPNTDEDYQNLNPNTDALYQSLNPNTIQPNADYQTLNPDALYQSLNPNTIQPNAEYQSLNLNTR